MKGIFFLLLFTANLMIMASTTTTTSKQAYRKMQASCGDCVGYELIGEKFAHPKTGPGL